MKTKEDYIKLIAEAKAAGNTRLVNNLKAEFTLIDHFDKEKLQAMSNAVQGFLSYGEILGAINYLLSEVSHTGEKKL